MPENGQTHFKNLWWWFDLKFYGQTTLKRMSKQTRKLHVKLYLKKITSKIYAKSRNIN